MENPMSKNIRSVFLALLALAAAAPMLSACNTTAGAGEDMSAAGNAIEQSAEKNKPY
jgi:predicted small secreted protein